MILELKQKIGARKNYNTDGIQEIFNNTASVTNFSLQDDHDDEDEIFRFPSGKSSFESSTNLNRANSNIQA